MAKKGSLIFPIVFMLVLTAVLTGVLAFLNQQTLPTIAFNGEIELKSKILDVFNVLPEKATPEQINTLFEKEVKTSKYDGKNLYTLEKDGKVEAYAVPFNGPGLWGSIDGYLGIDKDMTKTVGITFIKQDETPGLGGRISEPDYQKQYRGIDISKPTDGNIIINKPANGGNVDAIAGATQTSSFVTKMINEDVQKFIKEKKGE